jgi:putative chitinase
MRAQEFINEDFPSRMSTKNMIAYLRQHHDNNLHQDYLAHINTFDRFILTDIPVNLLKTELPGLDREKVEQYKKMDFSKAPPIVLANGYILDGYHRATVAKALGVPTIKCYMGMKGKNWKVSEDIGRRGFLGALGAGAMAASGAAQAKINPTPKPVANNPKAELLMKWAKEFIKDPAELAAFMAQCAHESDNFKAMEEYGSPERFAKKYDIKYSPAKAKQLGNTQPGDGIKYRGRGYIQLTGKYNYQKAGEWVSKYINHPVDFVKNPDMVATPTAAALSSLWYWMTFVRPRTKSFGNTKQVTKNINPGLKGQKSREQKARDWQAHLNVKPGQPVKVASR